MKDKLVTTQVSMEEMLPLAKRCVKWIEEHQKKKDAEFILMFQSNYNKHWLNRFFKRTLNTIEETEEYMKECLRQKEYSFHLQINNEFWPCMDYWGTKAEANIIIDHFAKSEGKNHILTISIDSYNAIARFKDI